MLSGLSSAGELLQLFRTGEVATRSELQRVTGLARSTVAPTVDALLAAGYFGAGLPASAATGPAPSDAKAKSVTVEGLHLCCGKCVDAFNKAVKAAPGVTKTDAAKDAKTVTVQGDVSPKAVIDALHKAGFNATAK